MTSLPALALATLFAACALANLEREMAEAAAPTRGHVGAAALLVETGELVSWKGGDRFPMQSVYKAPIAMAVPGTPTQGGETRCRSGRALTLGPVCDSLRGTLQPQ